MSHPLPPSLLFLTFPLPTPHPRPLPFSLICSPSILFPAHTNIHPTPPPCCLAVAPGKSLLLLFHQSSFSGSFSPLPRLAQPHPLPSDPLAPLVLSSPAPHYRLVPASLSLLFLVAEAEHRPRTCTAQELKEVAETKTVMWLRLLSSGAGETLGV